MGDVFYVLAKNLPFAMHFGFANVELVCIADEAVM